MWHRLRYALPVALLITGAILIIISVLSRLPSPPSPLGEGQPLTDNNQQSTVNSQQPTANGQQPTINSQPPTTNHQSPATSHQPPATSHQPPATLEPSTFNFQPFTNYDRFGATGWSEHLVPAQEAGLPFAHYLNWSIWPGEPAPQGVTFWHLVNLTEAGPEMNYDELSTAVIQYPGAIWVIGNEPDVIWQDNVTPQRYAELYHDLHQFITELDPTAQIAIGGVGQPTPLRRAYLDIVLDSYLAQYGEAMPIDIWTVHGFILREEADSWGVNIPPGMTAEQATVYEITDHGNLAIFQQNMIDFRAWMATRGYRERPLALTEYGIIFPTDYGYPPEVRAEFMVTSFDFLLTAVDPETGYPPDDNRLVQWWFWYNVYDATEQYTPSNLYDFPTNTFTFIGQVYVDYVLNLPEN